MESLEVLEKMNRLLVEATKKNKVMSENVVEQDKLKSDKEHDFYNTYTELKAKQKREFADEYFKLLDERHKVKFESEENEILTELMKTPNIEKALGDAVCKLRKLDKKIKQPMYYYRSETAKKEKGEFYVGNK